MDAKNQTHAANIIRRIARKRNVTESDVRAELLEAMNAGRTNPDPAVQEKWAEFHYSGAEPTVEEFIMWVASLLGCGRTTD